MRWRGRLSAKGRATRSIIPGWLISLLLQPPGPRRKAGLPRKTRGAVRATRPLKGPQRRGQPRIGKNARVSGVRCVEMSGQSQLLWRVMSPAAQASFLRDETLLEWCAALALPFRRSRRRRPSLRSSQMLRVCSLSRFSLIWCRCCRGNLCAQGCCLPASIVSSVWLLMSLLGPGRRKVCRSATFWLFAARDSAASASRSPVGLVTSRRCIATRPCVPATSSGC